MPRWHPCAEPGCPTLTTDARCPSHAKAERRTRQRRTDAQRPTARARGYDQAHETQFRRPVLARDPTCVECGLRPSRHADHHPHTRAELVRMGENPNDPRWGRGLCTSCHSTATAAHDGGYGNPRAPHGEA